VRNVTQIQLSTLELPASQTHMTVEADVNDRIWFSEGLKLDLGETDGAGSLLKTDVNGISGLNMRNNQLCIRENATTNFIVGAPAYLCPITAVHGGTGAITCVDTSANYNCYLAWSQTVTSAPNLRIVAHSATYDEILDTSTFAVRVPGDAALFANSFVCCPPLSAEELASYLTFALQNYAAYFGVSAPQNTYSVSYRDGYMTFLTSRLVTPATLQFPTTANASTALHYGTQYPDFANRTPLNGPGQTVTSLGHVLGFAPNTRFRSWTETAQGGSRTAYSGLIASSAPRFLFEARLLPGIYTQQTLSAALPIALNPLYFPRSDNLPGFGYVGFRDSLGSEKLVVVPPGQYTVETFCRALSYLLTRLDEQGLFYATSRFSYRGTPLDGNSGARPSVTFSNQVVYDVSYDFATSKFTIQSGYLDTAQPNDPSGNPLSLSSKDGPPFGLYFRPASLSKIAAKVADLDSLAANSQIDRLANVLGFEIQDYVGQRSYTAPNASHVPRIATTLSQGAAFSAARPRVLAYSRPGELGVSSAPHGAGPTQYMYPSGRYTATGNSPATNGLNLVSGSDTGHASAPTFGKKAGIRTDGLKLTVTNDGQAASDYTVSVPSSYYASNMYVVGDATYTSPQRPGNVVFKVNSVVRTSGAAVDTVQLVDAGSGLSAQADVSFNEILAYERLRKGVRSTSAVDPTCTFSSHATHESSTRLAATMSEPLGFQVGDLVQIRCAQEALSVEALAPNTQVTIAFTGPNRSIPESTTYTPSGGAVTTGEYHVVLGGNYDAVVQVTEDASGNQVLSVVDPGTQYYAGDTYYLSKAIRYAGFSGLITQLPNAGGQFLDAANASNEQFYSALPLLSSSTACVAGRYSDGSVARVRIPPSLRDNGFGHFQSMHFELPVRTDFHMQDGRRTSKLRQYSAHALVGLGTTYVPIRANVEFPAHMDVAPVPYILVAIPSLQPFLRTQIMGSTTTRQDVLGKVILGAPVAISKTSPMSLYLDHATIDQLRIEFRLPDNETRYNFHGLDHTLTLSVVEDSR
jgi:hypothetical protein